METSATTLTERSFVQIVLKGDSSDTHIKMLLSIPFKEKKIAARIDCINEKEEILKNNIWIVLTHGAGGDLNIPQLSATAEFLAKSNFIVFRFTCKGLNIKYRINVFGEMLKFIIHSYSPKGIFVGGRSMGARAATMLTVKELTAPVFEKIMGVICLSYPLHKVNYTNELRDESLKQSTKPLFFLSGTKDEMCKKELLESVLNVLKCPYKIHWLNGYNHSAKSSENFNENIYIDAFKEISTWCTDISNS